MWKKSKDARLSRSMTDFFRKNTRLSPRNVQRPTLNVQHRSQKAETERAAILIRHSSLVIRHSPRVSRCVPATAARSRNWLTRGVESSRRKWNLSQSAKTSGAHQL